MGGICYHQIILHKNVTIFPNQIPIGQQYQFYQSHSIRFSQVTVNKNNQQKQYQYNFIMKLLNNDLINIDLIIINQKHQRIYVNNYQLKISKRMIIDIFNKKLTSTLIQAKNQKSGLYFSLQIATFKGYTSQNFKKYLYTLYILKKRINQIQNNDLYFHKLIDNFVYGCNPDRQALVLLYQRADTSLANIAQYRKLANWPWTTQEKLKIFTDIMQGVYILHQKGIYHRDLRPSNIFFIEKYGRYVIGNFTKSIQIPFLEQDNQNRTVYGIQYMYKKQQNCLRKDIQVIGNYIKDKKQLAPYSPKFMDYYGLSTIFQILESLDILNLKPLINDLDLKSVLTQYNKIYQHPFTQVRQKIKRITQKYDIKHVKLTQDIQISGFVTKLTYLRHQKTFQQYTYQLYDILGYEIQFSNIAYKLIQRNNENNKNLENAYILKNLGQFLQRSGAKGTQSYMNACFLFLKKSQKLLNLGNLQKAKQEYNQAQKCYMKFGQNYQSYTAYIQLHRINALIKIQQNQKNPQKAIQIIKQTFQYAVNKKLSIQKQMTVLLTYAKIHLKGNQLQRKTGEQKLKNGLAICQNKGAFENFSSCNLFTSNFLYQIGKLNVQKIKSKQFLGLSNQKIKSISELNELNEINKNKINFMPQKAIAQSNLKTCLEIRQRQVNEPISLVSVLKSLGELYYQIQQFNEAKKSLQRCQMLLKDIQKQVSKMYLIKIFYLFGSVLYALKEYSQAQKRYQKAFNIISSISDPSYDLLKFNIKGNLGLSQMQGGKQEGNKNIQSALNSIKMIKSTNFFDYVFLHEKAEKIKQLKKKQF